MVDGDDPVQVKFECKEVDPCENSRAVQISPHNSGIVIRANRKSSSSLSLSRRGPLRDSRMTSSTASLHTSAGGRLLSSRICCKKTVDS